MTVAIHHIVTSDDDNTGESVVEVFHDYDVARAHLTDRQDNARWVLANTDMFVEMPTLVSVECTCSNPIPHRLERA